MIDAHCHLSISKFNSRPNPLWSKIEEIVSSVIVIDSVAHPEDLERSLELSEKYKNKVFVSAGLHPTEIFNLNEEEIEKYKEKIMENKEKIVAIGEIGLDYYYFKNEKEKEKQKEIFIDFIELAKKIRKPIVLHLRDAIDEGFEIIKSYGVKNAMFHFFMGKKEQALKIVGEGYLISIPSLIAKSKNLKKVAKAVPIENLLAETDSPWASPFNEEFNTPLNVKVVYEKISEIKKIELNDVERKIDENAKKFFNLLI